MEKTCRVCLIPQPPEAFGPRRAKCKRCAAAENAQRYLAKRDERLAKTRQWRAANPDKVKAICARQYANRKARGGASWSVENPEKAREYNAAYRKQHAAKLAEKRKAYYTEVIAKNERMLAEKYANTARYKAAKLRAIPPWADEEKTRAIYREARALRALGVDCHVDHIQPLRGKTVSGLHWHGNLRIVLATENFTKNAKPPPDSEALAVSLAS